jgi:3-methyladenine DNA glycosylase AlkD
LEHSTARHGPFDADEVVARLRGMGSERNREGMARFGINTEKALGIGVTQLRKLARSIGRDHELAADLWATGIHEARILASMVDEPSMVTRGQMDRWARDFDSWDLVDQCCGNLFDKTPHAWDKAVQWSKRKPEFTKRAGFALMAWLAVHDKTAPDKRFRELLSLIEQAADDDRNFVKKAVNWALRQIGKRNAALNGAALKTAHKIAKRDSKSARWIARDAIRELETRRVRVEAR